MASAFIIYYLRIQYNYIYVVFRFGCSGAFGMLFSGSVVRGQLVNARGSAAITTRITGARKSVFFCVVWHAFANESAASDRVKHVSAGV